MALNTGLTIRKY